MCLSLCLHGKPLLEHVSRARLKEECVSTIREPKCIMPRVSVKSCNELCHLFVTVLNGMHSPMETREQNSYGTCALPLSSLSSPGAPGKTSFSLNVQDT